MFKTSITELEINTHTPLLIQVDPTDSLAPWQHVGTITRTDDRLWVRFRAGAEHVRLIWEASVEDAGGFVANGQHATARVRFGVYTARGVRVLVSASVKWAAMGRAQRAAWERHGKPTTRTRRTRRSSAP